MFLKKKQDYFVVYNINFLMKEYIQELIKNIEDKKRTHNIDITPDYIYNEYLGYAEKNNLEKSWWEYEKFAEIFLQEWGLVSFL